MRGKEFIFIEESLAEPPQPLWWDQGDQAAPLNLHSDMVELVEQMRAVISEPLRALAQRKRKLHRHLGIKLIDGEERGEADHRAGSKIVDCAIGPAKHVVVKSIFIIPEREPGRSAGVDGGSPGR